MEVDKAGADPGFLKRGVQINKVGFALLILPNFSQNCP